MISSAKENGIVKPWRFWKGDFKNKNQVKLLVGN